jgi:cytochrome c-type biogenesis protein CcmF
MCELIDYRYARYLGGPRRMIHPFIHRGLWRDVQVWFPAVEYGATSEAAGAGALSAARQASKVPVVLKVFPLLSWVWIGLLLALGGAAVLTFQELRAGRRMQRDPRPVPGQEAALGEP